MVERPKGPRLDVSPSARPRKQRGDWPHQAPDRLHGFEQQQYCQVDGHDDEQAPDDRARDEFASVFMWALPGPLVRENTETAQPYPSDALSRLQSRRPPSARFAVSDTTTTVPRRTSGKGTSCAKADGPESRLFHPPGSQEASHTPVRRSPSETPCARAWAQQAVAEWRVSGRLVDAGG
jgi:hypothetical protein